MGLIDSIKGKIKEGIDQVGAIKLSGNARYLASKEIEIAKSVFDDTIPYSRVYVTDGLGLDGRPYTLPRPATSRDYIVHVGDGYYGMSFLPEDKKTLVHELTHVWQGEHSRWGRQKLLPTGNKLSRHHTAYARCSPRSVRSRNDCSLTFYRSN